MIKGIMGSECSLLLVEVHGMSFWLKDKPQILVNEFFMVSPSTVLRHNELWSTWTECEIPLLIIRFIIASSMLLCFCTSTFLKTAVYPVTLWNWQSSHYTYLNIPLTPVACCNLIVCCNSLNKMLIISFRSLRFFLHLSDRGIIYFFIAASYMPWWVYCHWNLAI